jgi:hypothetical protein
MAAGHPNPNIDEFGESCEDLRSWQESQGENAEAVEEALPPEAHVLFCGVVEGDVEVDVPQIDGCCSITWSEGVANILCGLHAFNFFKFRIGHIPPLFFGIRKIGLM